MSVHHPEFESKDSFWDDPSVAQETRIDRLLACLTLEEKVHALSTDPAIPRLGLRGLTHVEGLHGLAQDGEANWLPENRIQTTVFPQAYGLGHTWSPELLKRVAEQQAKECRYIWHHPSLNQGGLIVLAPNADLGRDPRWGRTEECFGEDAFLVGELVTAFVTGLQGDGEVWTTASLMKHFLANSHENDRESTSSDFSQRLWHEYYSYPFRKGVEAGSRAYMASYNAVNGVPSHVHPMHKSIVADEWGFDGFVCTDGGALGLLKSDHKYSDSLPACSAAIVKAGIGRFLDDYKDSITAALNDGLLTESDIDEVLRGFLRVADNLGELRSHKSGDQWISSGPPWESEEAVSLAREVTAKSIVLLKNEGILPLKNVPKKIAVIGEHSDHVLIDWYSGCSTYSVGPYEGIQNRFPEADVRTEKDPALALELAREADVVFLCAGNQPIGELGWAKVRSTNEGKESIDREGLDLDDEDFVKAVFAVNPNTVLVLVSSFPYAINWSQANLPAIIHAVHSSQELGNGLADVISGDVNPAGRLTQTWPKSVEDLPPMMDYDITKGRTYLYASTDPLYPFGFGLSYSSFSYQDLAVQTAQDSVRVTVTVKNDSDRSGEEVVQVYAKYKSSKVLRPNIQLVGFKRVQVSLHTTIETNIVVSLEQFQYWDEAASEWVLEPGDVELFVGPNSKELRISSSVFISGKV